MPRLNLTQTTDVLLKWIESVKTREQIVLVKEAVDTFIVKRFSKSEKVKLKESTDKLDQAIHEKEFQIFI